VALSTLGGLQHRRSPCCWLTKPHPEPVYYGDLQHIDKASREIKNFIGDGACPPLAGRASWAPRFRRARASPPKARRADAVKLCARWAEGVLARAGEGVNGEFTLVVTHATSSSARRSSSPNANFECAIPFWPARFH